MRVRAIIVTWIDIISTNAECDDYFAYRDTSEVCYDVAERAMNKKMTSRNCDHVTSYDVSCGEVLSDKRVLINILTYV